MYVMVIQFKAVGHAWDHPKSFRMAYPQLCETSSEARALWELAGGFDMIPPPFKNRRDYKLSASVEVVDDWIKRERALAQGRYPQDDIS